MPSESASAISGAISRYLSLIHISSPLDIPAIEGTDPDGNEVVRHSSDEDPFSALVFKIMTDPFVGKLAYFRVYSGSINSGSYVLNATKGKKERVGRILQMHANKRQELDKVYSGDIAAAIGFKFSTTCLLYTSAGGLFIDTGACRSGQ